MKRVPLRTAQDHRPARKCAWPGFLPRLHPNHDPAAGEGARRPKRPRGTGRRDAARHTRMQETATERRKPEKQRRIRRVGPWVAAGVALAGIGVVLLPAIPIVLGVLLVVAVAVHAWWPDVRPYAATILRVPVARPGRQYAHLALVAGAGVLLVAAGAAGATLRGRISSEWAQRSRQTEATAARVDGILARARQRIGSGDVPGAELALFEVDTIDDIDARRRDEVDELRGRVQRSGDARAILDILVALSADDFAALEDGTAVPEAFELGERALTYRAVSLALDQLDTARRERAYGREGAAPHMESGPLPVAGEL